MKSLIILLISVSAFARTEAECLTRMSKATKYSETDMVKIIMTCNNKLLDGVHMFIYANNQTEKLIRKRYPSADKEGNDYPVGTMERALMMLDHGKCEEVTNLFQTYMKVCQATKSSRELQSLD